MWTFGVSVHGKPLDLEGNEWVVRDPMEPVSSLPLHSACLKYHTDGCRECEDFVEKSTKGF